MPQGRLSRPAVPPGAAFLGARSRDAARRTDDRLSVGWLLGLFRPGAGTPDPMAPGPRPPVSPNALLAIPLQRSDPRRDGQLAQLAIRPGDVMRPQLTAEQLDGDRVLRRTQVGKARPLSYVYRFVGRVGIGGTPAGSTETEAAPASDRLPCIDCG